MSQLQTRYFALAAVVPGLILGLSACAGSPAETVTVTETPAAASAEPSAEPTPIPSETAAATTPAKSERGAIIKTVGESGGVGDPNTGEMAYQFTITAITPNFQCTAPYATGPENGQFIALDVTASLAPDASETLEGNGLYFLPRMTAHEFSVVGPDGISENSVSSGSAWMGCVPDSEMLPSEFAPGQNYSGKVILDAKNASGTIVYSYDTAKWEWAF